MLSAAAERMLEKVRAYGHVSFPELMRSYGEGAEGNFAMTLPERPNTVLWAGMSEAFLDAFDEIGGWIEPAPAHILVYLADGGLLKMPIARRPSKTQDYRRPHWIPLTFNVRRHWKPEAPEARCVTVA